MSEEINASKQVERVLNAALARHGTIITGVTGGGKQLTTSVEVTSDQTDHALGVLKRRYPDAEITHRRGFIKIVTDRSGS